MNDQIIGMSTEDIAYIDGVLASGEHLYRAYDRVLTYLEPGTDRYFWFEQASIINQQANGIAPPSNNNLSNTYIIAHSAYGLALDGHNNDLAVTSNAIATAVIRDVKDNIGVPPLQAKSWCQLAAEQGNLFSKARMIAIEEQTND